MGVSLKRLESLSLRELSIMIQSDSRLDSVRLLNITEIRITNDLSYMTIYYTVLDDKNKQKMAENLESLKPYIRRELAHKINARKMPDLIFKYDEALEYGNHIAEILESEKKKFNN